MIRHISHNAPFGNRNVHTCAHFCYKMVYCGIWDGCIVRFGQRIYWDDLTLMWHHCNANRNDNISFQRQIPKHWDVSIHFPVLVQISAFDNRESRRYRDVWANSSTTQVGLVALSGHILKYVENHNKCNQVFEWLRLRWGSSILPNFLILSSFYT